MSLWEKEVERSKDNPSSSTRRKTPGRLFDNLIHASHRSKNRPDPGYPQFYKAPTRSDRLSETEVIADRETLIKENIRLRKRLDRMDATPPITDRFRPQVQDNTDQIAQLIIQKSQLEQEMGKREKRYEHLLTESQTLLKQMRHERDAAKHEITELKIEVRELQRQQSLRILRHSRERSLSPLPPLDFGPPSPISFPDPVPVSPQVSKLRYASSTKKQPNPPITTTENLATIFKKHNDQYFMDQYQGLETCIRHFVLDATKTQPDAVPEREVSSSVNLYLTKHNLQIPTVFGIREVRCIVCRGFIIEFLLERIFRVFLFGVDGVVMNDLLKEGYGALSALDVKRGSKWAAGMARSIIRNYKHYNPRRAAGKVVDELCDHLRPLIESPEPREGLLKIVMAAVRVARDCRLDFASFSIEVPPHLTSFDPIRMESSRGEEGRVALSYFPTVIKRPGEDSRNGHVLVKAKVWRESVFADLQNLMDDRVDWDRYSEDDSV